MLNPRVMRTSTGPILLAACLAGAAACGGSDTGTDPIDPADDGGVTPDGGGLPDPTPDGGGPIMKKCAGTSMELGSGVRSFENVADGGTVALYRGPQGGYMIYLSVRAVGLDPTDVTLCYSEKLTAGGVEFGKGCWKIMLTNDLGSGRFERVGVWGQVDPSYWTKPEALRGQDAQVNVTLVDGKGCSEAAGWQVHISEQAGT